MNIDNILKSHGIGLFGGSVIKSIQRGLTSKGYGAKFVNTVISKVDLTKSIILINSNVSTAVTLYPSGSTVKASFLNDTTLQFSSYDTSGTADISWTVIEFKDLKTIQSGTIVVSGAVESSVTVSEIELSKSILFTTFTSNSQNTHFAQSSLKSYIKTKTELGFISQATAVFNANWFLVEFK